MCCSCEVDADRDLIIREIFTEFSDVELRLKHLFSDCEATIADAINEVIDHSETDEASGCDSSGSDHS